RAQRQRGRPRVRRGHRRRVRRRRHCARPDCRYDENEILPLPKPVARGGAAMIIRTSATRARFSRRAFLRGLGASGALLPLLHAERAPAATASGFPKRLITIAWSNGVAQPSFYPPADDPTASDILKALAPWKAKTLLVSGLDIKIMLDNNRT